MSNKYLYIAFWLGSFVLIPAGASAHHPGIGGVGGCAGWFRVWPSRFLFWERCFCSANAWSAA